MGPIQSLDDLFSLIRRRFWLIAVITLVGAGFSAWYAKSRPKLYEAVSVLQIEQARVQEGADPNETTAASAASFQAIEQRLMTRENLVAIMDRHGVFADLPGLTTDQKVALLRGSITFQQVASAANPSFGQAATLSAILMFVQMDDPEIAARVANDLAQSVLDASAADAIARATATRDFFADEEARLATEIVGLDSEIAAYRNQHADTLPAMEDARRDELVGIESDLRDAEQARITLVSDAETLQARETLRETDRRALEQLVADIARADAGIAALRARRAELTDAIRGIPEVERQLGAYDRQLQQVQDQYRIASQRLAEATTNLRLAQNQQEERLALLERATVPEQPVSGGARRLAAAGAVASLGAALLLAFLLDLRRPVLRTERALLRETGLQAIVAIPDIVTTAKQNAAQRYGFAAFLVGLFAVTLGVMVT
jgi:tyrosine-protein kinase Etk/Wzc